MGFLTFKNLFLLSIISIFIFLILRNINFSNNLNVKTLKNIFFKKYLYYYCSNFVGKTFLNEALILMIALGLMWFQLLHVFYESNAIYVLKWPLTCILLYALLQRIILVHFLSYVLCLKIFKSWLAFRITFLFYVVADVLFYFFGYHYIDLLFIKPYIYFWYLKPNNPFFGINMRNADFFSFIYHLSFALPLVVFFILIFCGFYINFLKQFFFDFNFSNLLNSLKNSNFRLVIKNSYFVGFSRFFNSVYILLIAYFYAWAMLFGGLYDFWETFFHGPYFLTNVLTLVFKVITINLFFPSFLIWFFLFNAIYFWFKDLHTFSEIRTFLFYIYNYYTGSQDNMSFATRLKNAFYLFISFVLPICMIFDISFISTAIAAYLFFLEDLQFWITFFIPFAGLYVFVLAIMPNNDPTHEQSNGRLFCLWIFNFSLLISLFFVNSTVLYVVNSNSINFGRKIYTGDTVFTSLSAAIDSTWTNFTGGAPLSLLSNFSAGIFTFGYDYFAILLCTATSLIFSLVFLTSLFAAGLNRKRYFFMNLLLIEICVLLSFLSLNLLGFFVFFESSLVPMFLIIGLWGSSDRRWFAAKQMLFYSLTSSTPMIICMVHFYSVFGSLDYAFLYSMIPLMSSNEKFFFWWSLFLMFATKVPMFPFHSWLLNAHVEAPTGGSIILAAILLKLGIFGIVRYLFQFFNEISMQMAPFVISLALIGVLYSSVCAITELDCKRLIAHTSIAHMNIAVIGLFIFDERGLSGAIYLSIGHVVTSAALFFLIGALYDRFHTRNLLVFGGLVQIMPIFSTLLFFFVMANSGFPWTLSFIGEFLILAGVARKLSLLVYLVLIVASVSLMYANLRLFIFICFGTINKNLIHNSVSDLTFLELYCAILLSLNGFVLMWNSNLFFAALFDDNIVRIIF